MGKAHSAHTVSVGASVGSRGASDGSGEVGPFVGLLVGKFVGVLVGLLVGREDGLFVGVVVGSAVGLLAPNVSYRFPIIVSVPRSLEALSTQVDIAPHVVSKLQSVEREQ